MSSFLTELTTAIVIPMPPAVQSVALPIASHNPSKSFYHYPSHITLFIPFASLDLLNDACQKLRLICRDIDPFEITLDGYSEFPTVLFMQLQDPSPVQQLFQTLFAHFPQYPPYGGQFGTQLYPHVTVAYVDTPEQKQDIQLPKYEPILVEVNRLNVIYGSLHIPAPFATYDVIHFGK